MFDLRVYGVSAGPSIKIKGRELIVKTALTFRVFTLFIFVRTVTFDSKRSLILYKTRWFWLYKGIQIIRFSDIDHIDYTFNNIGTDRGIVPNRGVFGRHDTMEWFGIYIVLKNDQKKKVCMFLGEGSVSNGLSGWLLGDDLIDVRGNQEQESCTFVQFLCKLLSVQIGKEVFADTQFNCKNCNRSISKYSEYCLYCGEKTCT